MGKHIERKYHLILKIVYRGDIMVEKISSINNLTNLFTKTLTKRVFDGHRDNIVARCVASML